jgi:adenylate cyclase class 2
VLDETPIGNFAELEGPADWIDQTASTLAIHPSQYITLSYGRLFDLWREQHASSAPASSASDLTFAAIANARSEH